MFHLEDTGENCYGVKIDLSNQTILITLAEIWDKIIARVHQSKNLEKYNIGPTLNKTASCDESIPLWYKKNQDQDLHVYIDSKREARILKSGLNLVQE